MVGVVSEDDGATFYPKQKHKAGVDVNSLVALQRCAQVFVVVDISRMDNFINLLQNRLKLNFVSFGKLF